MLNNIDWQFLKRPLIFFMVCLILLAAFVVLGQQYEQGKLDSYNSTKSSLSSTHSTYNKLVQDLDLLQQYTQAYDEYKSSGLLGAERRLSWIETLETINDKLRLPTLTYSLQPQESFTAPRLTVENNVTVNSTPMDLNMALLHEQDLLSVFENIDSEIANLFTIDSCKINRLSGKNTALNTKKANLSSNCLMRWITVDVK